MKGKGKRERKLSIPHAHRTNARKTTKNSAIFTHYLRSKRRSLAMPSITQKWRCTCERNNHAHTGTVSTSRPQRVNDRQTERTAYAMVPRKQSGWREQASVANRMTAGGWGTNIWLESSRTNNNNNQQQQHQPINQPTNHHKQKQQNNNNHSLFVPRPRFRKMHLPAR